MSKIVSGTYEIDPATAALPAEPVFHVAVDRADGRSCSHTWPSVAPSSEPCPCCGIVESHGPPSVTAV